MAKPEPLRCQHCYCDWHGTECTQCHACATSCAAPLVVVGTEHIVRGSE